MELTPTNFFSYYALHPTSPQLAANEQRVALAASIVLGVLTLGLYHVVCALVNHTFKWLPPGKTTLPIAVFQQTVLQDSKTSDRSSEPSASSPLPEEPSVSGDSSGSSASPPARPLPEEPSASDGSSGSSVLLPTSSSPDTSSFPAIEKHFWRAIINPEVRLLPRYLEMLLMKEAESGSCNWEAVASSLVDSYALLYSKTFNEETSLRLKKQVAQNLEHWPYEPKRTDEKGPEVAQAIVFYDRVDEKGSEAEPIVFYDRVLELPNNNYLGVFKTVGEGSCGFHALLGGPVIHGGLHQYMAANIGAVREEFCVYLSTCNAEGHLPAQIENVLDDYFTRFAISPARFQTDAVKEIQRALSSRYPVINAGDASEVRDEKIRLQEELKREFRTNKTVFEAYLKHLANICSDLLQDELVAVANWKGITIRLTQPGWGSDRYPATHSLNEGHRTTVDVYYNGHGHYERAVLIRD